MGFEAHPVTKEWVARPGRAVRSARRSNLPLYVLSQGRSRYRRRPAEPAGDEGTRGSGHRARVDRIRGRRSGRMGVARAQRGLRQAPPVTGDEACGRPAGVVHRVLLRRRQGSRSRPLTSDAQGRRGLRAVVRRPPGGGVSGGRGPAQSPRRRVLRREVHVRPRRIPGAARRKPTRPVVRKSLRRTVRSLHVADRPQP